MVSRFEFSFTPPLKFNGVLPLLVKVIGLPSETGAEIDTLPPLLIVTLPLTAKTGPETTVAPLPEKESRFVAVRLPPSVNVPAPLLPMTAAPQSVIGTFSV